MRTTNMLRSGLIAAALIGSAASVQAATLSGSFTADDYLQVYLSTDLSVSNDELIWNKQTLWGTTESFAGITLAPGQSIYLLIDAQNVFSGPAMFVGEFHINGEGFTFANGGTTLLTDTTHWLTSEAGFASAAAIPASHGANATLPIWGARSGISGDAEAIWAYYADWSSGYNGHAYFVAQITAVPEPGSALMFGAGLMALALVTRRRNCG